MSFDYLFSKSALNENYQKEVVGPVIAEILGGNPNQEINTTNIGASPGVPGRTSGNWEINSKNNIVYVWNDGPERICRRISFIIYDNKLFLQACLRALAIKKKELARELSKPSNSNNFSTNQPDKTNYTLWINLSLAAFFLIGLVFYFILPLNK